MWLLWQLSTGLAIQLRLDSTNYTKAKTYQHELDAPCVLSMQNQFIVPYLGWNKFLLKFRMFLLLFRSREGNCFVCKKPWSHIRFQSLKRDWVLKDVLKRKNALLISKIPGFAFDYVLIRAEVDLNPEGPAFRKKLFVLSAEIQGWDKLVTGYLARIGKEIS